jgi:hypothetical protein
VGEHSFRTFLAPDFLFCVRFNFDSDHRQTTLSILSNLKSPVEFREKNSPVKSTDLKRIRYVERK